MNNIKEKVNDTIIRVKCEKYISDMRGIKLTNTDIRAFVMVNFEGAMRCNAIDLFIIKGAYTI